MKQKRLLTMLVLLAAVVSGAWAQWTGGTHTATANENLNAINVSDDATLTINQGVTVTVSGGITVASGKTLTVTGGGTLVANGANGGNGDNNQPGNAGGTAITGNVIINGVGLTVTANGGKGGQGGQGYDGDNGFGDGNGGQGDNGSTGGNGGSAFSGAVTIYAGSVTAIGGQGGIGGTGGDGGQGGTGDGGNGGTGGTGGTGGNGGYAFAGTLTVFGGNVNAYGGDSGPGGSGGYGGEGGDSYGEGGEVGDHGEPGEMGEYGFDGVAYANNVTFQATTHTMTDGTNNITNATGEKTVIITSPDVLPAPSTYAITLAEGTEDADKWTVKVGEGEAQAFPVEGLEGETVTVTYTGTKRVKSVKAVKEGGAAGKAAAEATAEDKGKLIGRDGNIYADVAAATAAGTTAVAKIIYIGTTGHATYSHGLALALTDEGNMAWGAAMTACNTTKNTSTPVTDATWLLASQEQWNYMLGTNGAGSYTDLRDGFSGISGASNLQSGFYWSSTLYGSNNAWDYYFVNGNWYDRNKFNVNPVRACLAF